MLCLRDEQLIVGLGGWEHCAVGCERSAVVGHLTKSLTEEMETRAHKRQVLLPGGSIEISRQRIKMYLNLWELA